jgi:guanylate kinase
MLAKNELLEWAKVYGCFYGVPKEEARQALARGLDVIIKVDVQGAATIKSVAPQSLLIFLAPASMEELEERLRKRKTESGSHLALRIKTALEEMKRLPLFDYVVVNHHDRLDLAVAQIDSIIVAEKCRVNPRVVDL